MILNLSVRKPVSNGENAEVFSDIVAKCRPLGRHRHARALSLARGAIADLDFVPDDDFLDWQRYIFFEKRLESSLLKFSMTEGALVDWMESGFGNLVWHWSPVRKYVSLPLVFLDRCHLDSRLLAKQLVFDLLQLEGQGFDLLVLIIVSFFQFFDSGFKLSVLLLQESDPFLGSNMQMFQIAETNQSLFYFSFREFHLDSIS